MENRFDITVNDDRLGECEFTELLAIITRSEPGDKIEIEVVQ